ncbi:dolichyl-phosphate beta-glucosyltransferase [Deltaproteobacteria bacterium TL4]
MKNKILLIVPCYNEAQRLPREAYLSFFQTHPHYDFCFVDDGSLDQTGVILKQMANEFQQVVMLTQPRNQGKAEAIRLGVQYAASKKQYHWLGYWDADLATPLSALDDFMRVFIKSPELSLVMGSRVMMLGRLIQRYWYRHYLGRIFATFASLLLNLSVYDTQCGAKIFKMELAEKVFRLPFLTRWLFDVEILARMNQELGVKRTPSQIYELVLNEWHDVGTSKLSLGNMLQVPWQFIKLAHHYQCYKFYRSSSSS